MTAGTTAGAALLRGLTPMLATPGPLPADDGSWAFEVKWDGVRALVAVCGGAVALSSRRGGEITSSYPELAELAGLLGGRTALLDGELVALNAQGGSDFGRLQARMHVGRPSAELLRATPVQLLAFDLLHLDGRDLLGDTYDRRRAALEDLGLAGAHCAVPPAFPVGAELFAATREQGLEGVVAKRRDSRYLPGRRTSSWIKVRHVRRTSALICGWRPGQGGRAGQIGSLLLGVPAAGGLHYAGHVGTGFTTAMLELLGRRLAPLRVPDPPFAAPVPRDQARDAVWVRPELVAEVSYTEWTRDGRLRHPSFVGLRDDLDPEAVVRQ